MIVAIEELLCYDLSVIEVGDIVWLGALNMMKTRVMENPLCCVKLSLFCIWTVEGFRFL